MSDLPPPYPGKPNTVAMPPESKLKPEVSLKRNSRGDHIYEDLDGLGLSFDTDEYLNPAFVKDRGNDEYTGLQLKNGAAAGGLDAYEAPSPSLQRDEQPAYYLDLNHGHEQHSGTGSVGSYTDLRTNPLRENRTPKTSVSSLSGGWPPQQPAYESSQMPPKPPASPRPSKTSVTSNWPPMEQPRTPRISATRPPPSPRFSQAGPAPRISQTGPPPPSPRISQTGPAPRISQTAPPPSPRFSQAGPAPRISQTRPPPSPRMSATQRPPSSESTYFSSLGVPPAAPGHYEVSMNMR